MYPQGPPEHRKEVIRNPLENRPAVILNGPDKGNENFQFPEGSFDLEIPDGNGNLNIYRPIADNNLGALLLFSHTEKAD